jgi:ATP-dependent Clp protease protease subunit
MKYMDKYFFIKNKMQSFVKSDMVDDVLHIYMYGFISQNDINSADVINEVHGKIESASQIVLHLNSDGGDVKEGLNIYDYFSRYSNKLNVIVEGAACSISSIIALAGKNLQMTPNSFFMIHLPFIENMSGTSHDLMAMSDLLGKIEERLLNIYVEKIKKPAEEIFAKMIKESWFSASEAYEYGISNGVFLGRSDILPINILNSSNMNPDKLKNILIEKRLKEFKIMNAKHKAELLRIKAEMKEVEEMVNEVSEEEMPVEPVAVDDAPVVEEVPVAVEEEMPVVEEEAPVAIEEPMVEEMVEVPASIDTELLTELVEILTDENGTLAAGDLMEVLEEKDPMAAMKKAGTMCKARLLNKLKTNISNKRDDFTKINAVKNQSSTATDGTFKRIDFSALPKQAIKN